MTAKLTIFLGLLLQEEHLFFSAILFQHFATPSGTDERTGGLSLVIQTQISRFHGGKLWKIGPRTFH
jgi:hypothetical protein